MSEVHPDMSQGAVLTVQILIAEETLVCSSLIVVEKVNIDGTSLVVFWLEPMGRVPVGGKDGLK